MFNLNNILSKPHQREQLFKYLMLLGVMGVYFGYLSWEYGLADGGIVAVLTWSFFVLCTPVADAGFLLDFPVRLITGLKMLYTEILVWILAVCVNVVALTSFDGAYDKMPLTRLLHEIIVTPWPYWGLIVLCCLGTFASVFFGDELLDVVSHNGRKHHYNHGFKYRVLAVVAFFILIVLAYYHLIESLGIEKIINGG